MKLRVTLLCIVLIARNCHFVVEHPFQTLISRHRRWEWFCNQVCWVTWVKFKKMQLPSSTWDLLGIYITYVTIGFEGLEIFLTYPPPEVLPISGLEGPILADALWGSHTKAKCPFQQLQVDPGCWPWATYQSCSGGTDPVQNHPLEPQQWQLQKYNIYIYIYIVIPVSSMFTLGRTISKGGREQFTGTSELKRTASHPHLSIYFHFGFFWPMHMPCWLQNNYTS